MAELLAQSEHLHHGAGAVLLAVPRLQPVPEFIVADWPATGRAPLRQRLGSGKRARLVAQHIEIMLEIQHMLAAAVTAFVAGDQTASMPDVDMQRMHPRFHPCARAVYTRFEGYVPRSEGKPSYSAGPKVTSIERVEWVILPDPATCAAALRGRDRLVGVSLQRSELHAGSRSFR